jgi:hypothetical protein
MTMTRLKSANLGKLKGGLPTVGYTLYDVTGSISQSRTTSGVYELGTTTGIYAVNVDFPNEFKGSILWDSGEASPVYATEEVDLVATDTSVATNVADIKTSLDTDLTFIRDMIGGQWKIDDSAYQMIFYKEDNVTEVARFDLSDNKGAPSFLSVFLRKRVP